MSAASPLNFQPMPLATLPERPLFSVLIPNYNYARYVGLAIESVLNQSYANLEIVVCDDGSTDSSREVIRQYVSRDRRAKLIEQENRGFASAVTTAFEAASGDPIALLDADDVFMPHKLEVVLAAFRNNPRSGLFANRVLPLSATGQPLGPPYPGYLEAGWLGPQKLRAGGCSTFPPTSGLSFRRDVLNQLIPVPPEVTGLVDYYLSRTAQFLAEVGFTPESLTEYRVHGASMSSASGSGASPIFSSFDPKLHAACATGLERMVLLQKRFLAQFYGVEFANALRLEDHAGYWGVLLALRVLQGQRAGTIRPYSVEEMIRHVPRPAERRLWQALVLLPHPLGSRMYRFWRSPSRLKSMVKTLVLPVLQR
jgi:glycosyltransferase involved in cell wall biosynthesis